MGFGQEPIPGMDDFEVPHAIAAPEAKPKVWRLKIVNGPRAGSTIELAGGVQVAGRNDPPRITVDIDLTDAELGEPPMLSRRHAQIEVSNDTMKIKDLGSTNGTFLKGEKLEPDDVRTVEAGGVALRLANLDFEVTYESD